MSYSLGIDVGTTYTAAAIADGGRFEVLQLGTRSPVMPSVVYLRAEGGLMTGEAAERRATADVARAAREFKRRFGDPAPVILGGSPFGTEALVAALLREVVARAVEARGERPSAVVVTHPASWSEYKLDLLREATRQADIDAPTFVSEPQAAAVHYASQERVEPGTVLAVYDFGGGTFDAAVVRKTEDGFELLGTPAGLERLGGADFDEAVLAHVRQSLETDFSTLDTTRPELRPALARLRDECQLAKEALSSDTETAIAVALPGIDTRVRLTRAEFEDAVRPRLDDTVRTLERAVKSAGLTMADIDRVLLIGGTSRIPLVRELVESATSRPVVTDAHPKHSISLGAARLAAERGASAGPATMATPATSATPPATVEVPPTEAVLEATVPGPGPVSDSAATRPNPEPSRSVAPEVPARPLPSAPRVAAPAAASTPMRRPLPKRGILIGAAILVVAIGVAVGAALFAGGGGGGDVSAADLAGATATINSVDLAGDQFEVAFTASGFTPSAKGGRLRFFWDTTSISQVSGSGSGPWQDWTTNNDFDGFSLDDQPVQATLICVVVVDSKGVIVANSGTCADLP